MPAADQFDTVVKHLDITPVTEAQQSLSATRINKRPYDITPIRDIGKLQYQIRVPATSPASRADHQEAYLAVQYNYTSSRPFRIFYNAINNSKMSNCSISIKYRVGSAVFRYFLGGQAGGIFETSNARFRLDPIPNFKMYVADLYTNQLIQPNFVIEIWATPRHFPFFRPGISINQDILINTSILVNPVDVNQSFILFPDGVLENDDMFKTFPEALPTPNVENAWLSN